VHDITETCLENSKVLL